MTALTRALSILFVVAVATLTAPSGSQAGHDDDIIAVIVHLDNPINIMSRSDLRPIFQTTQKEWPNGDRIMPLNLPASDSTRKGFDSAVLGLDPDRATRYWIDRKIRGGARPPKKAPNAALAVAVVSKKAEAISYVPLDKVTKDVKVVARIRNGRVEAP